MLNGPVIDDCQGEDLDGARLNHRGKCVKKSTLETAEILWQLNELCSVKGPISMVFNPKPLALDYRKIRRRGYQLPVIIMKKGRELFVHG